MKVDIFNTNKKYSIIYADPPWGYKNAPSKNGTSRGFAGYHYGLMSLKDLSALPIQSISTDNAVLLMWTTAPMIEKALELIKKWGFTYRTFGFVWVKKNKKANTNFWGCGYYTRSNVEVVLLATKGKTLERYSHRVHQIIENPVEQHSKKPDITRDKIKELFGDIPSIELFARQHSNGWDCWGNEV